MDRITIVLDSSGSMYTCRKAMVENVKEMLKSIRDNAKQYKQKTKVTLIDFNTRVSTIFKEVSSDDLNQKAYLDFNYITAGGTALFDAVGRAVEDMQESDAHTVLVFTDGEENSSLRYNAKSINKLIQEKQNEGTWTFAFNVPPGHYKRAFAKFGIPEDNIREWESHNARSVEETREETIGGINRHYENRSRGLTMSSNFYQTDLTNLTRKEVRQDLNAVNNVVQVQVLVEQQIRDCVSSNGIEYKKGKAYYELVKPELVQETKEILVMEVGKKTVWGGQEARDLIGIPAGRVKVVPGNHANFRIFVQSTSVNRKTVVGTTILVKQ